MISVLLVDDHPVVIEGLRKLLEAKDCMVRAALIAQEGEEPERAYQPATAMSFGHAIEAMKAGAKVARAGWNGKNMWIALTPGSAFEARHAKCGHAAAKRAVELGDPNSEIELLPHIDMRAADGCIVVGWLASQTDMLAVDWGIVE